AERYPGGTPPDALLYKVLRQAVLLEYANQAYRALVNANAITAAATKESELVSFPRAEQQVATASTRIAVGDEALTPWDAVSQTAPGITAPGQTIGDYLRTLPSGASGAFPRLG